MEMPDNLSVPSKEDTPAVQVPLENQPSVSKTKIVLFAAGVILLILVALGVYSLVITRKSNTGPQSSTKTLTEPTPSPTTIPDIINWKTFKEPTGLFEFKYPPDWNQKIAEATGLPTVFESPDTKKSINYFIYPKGGMGGKQTIDNYCPSWAEEKRKLVVDNLPAVYCVETLKNIESITTRFLIQKGEDQVEIWGFFDQNIKKDDIRSIFEQILSAFKFIK